MDRKKIETARAIVIMICTILILVAANLSIVFS